MVSVLRVSMMLLLLLSLSSLSAFVMFADAGGTSSAEEQEGVSYLVSNAQAPGVVVLPSGLQYKILRHGSGNAHPIEKTSCSFHYAGRLTTGTGETFDASYDRGKPTEVRPEQAIQGWSEAMKLMRKGDKWELTIPSHLAYGDRALPELGVPANAVLIYEVELVTMFGPTTPVVSPCTVIGGKFSSNEENGMEAPPLNFVECNTKEETYASKVYTKWTNEKVKSELTRLLELQKKGNVKSELLEWMDKRLRILNYVVSFENNVEYDQGGKAKDDTNMFDFRHDHDHDHEEGGHSHGHHGHHRHDGDQQDHGHDHDGRDHQHDHEHGHQHHGHEVYKSE